MNIKLKRYYWLIITFVAVVVLSLLAGNLRIISYNFGDGDDIKIIGPNYENEVDLFDDSVVHEITISMNNGDYETMIETYKETGEKDYFHANITIDRVTVENVGIRLKGNLTLNQALGTGMGGMNGGGGPNGGERPEMPEGFEPPDGSELPNGFEQQDEFAQPEDTENTESTDNTEPAEEKDREGNPFSGDFMEVEGEPPFLIKFDEFVAGQTYEEYTEIALRVSSNSDSALLVEQVAYYLHTEAGQVVPQTSYGYVQTADQEGSLYILTEHIDETYLDKHFPDSDGILYKAGNFTGFEYLGDDPELYADKFEQKTSINDDDMSQLIQFFKFVTESTDEEFEEKLPDWLDIDSFVRMLALDNLLGNNDSFGGMGSNYYLYYDKETEQFTMLSWDMNLAMGSMAGMGGGEMPEGGMPNMEDRLANMTEEEKEEFEKFRQNMEERMGDMEDKENGRMGGGGPGGNSTNLLKERFFANEEFSALYDEQYEELKDLIFTQGLALKKINQLAEAFTKYNEENNIMDQSEYDKGVENIKSYFIEK